MLQIVNHTPFEALLGMFTDADGHDVASVVLVATLEIPEQDGAVCRRAPVQLAPQAAASDVGIRAVERADVRFNLAEHVHERRALLWIIVLEPEGGE